MDVFNLMNSPLLFVLAVPDMRLQSIVLRKQLIGLQVQVTIPCQLFSTFITYSGDLALLCAKLLVHFDIGLLQCCIGLLIFKLLLVESIGLSSEVGDLSLPLQLQIALLLRVLGVIIT